MNVTVFALEGLWDTGLSVMLDALSAANALAASEALAPAAPIGISLVGVGAGVRTARGHTIATVPAATSVEPDWVLVPALPPQTPDALVRTLARPDVLEAVRHLREWSARGVRVGAACIGTFFLAEAGLLDGREATTNWASSPLFRERYPNVRLDESRLVVPSDTGATAGAAMAHLDLALWLVRASSPALADVVASYLVADQRSSQAPYVIPSHLAKADPLVVAFERWARTNLKGGFSLHDAADALATSARTLQRRCTVTLGKSPQAYFQDLRVERARTLIRAGEANIEAIAAEVGYEDGATLRALLRQRLGRGVRELRGANAAKAGGSASAAATPGQVG